MIVTDIKDICLLLEKSKVLIFDFDGVLADSNEIKTEAFSELYKSYGEDIVAKVVQHHKANGGMTRYEKFKHYHKSLLGKDIDQNQVFELSANFSELVLEKVISAPEIKSAESFLKKSCKKNKICSVNSATPEIELLKIIRMRKLEKYFSMVLGSPSSKSENIAKILNLTESNNDEALFFGDSKSDLIAADNLGIKFIGVGRFIRALMENRKGTYFQIDNFDDLSEF
jgi:phosphoglycolate phosphatase-like HAD superfamily hydrolase